MNQDLLECREKALSLKRSSNPPCYQNGRKKGYMRILKDLWNDVGYVNLGLSAQNVRDHAAAITDENSQISVRGDSSTVLDETEEVGASMLSQICLVMMCFPPKQRTKLGAVLVTHVSVILSTMFTMKSSTTGGIYSMFHRVAQGRVSLKN